MQWIRLKGNDGVKIEKHVETEDFIGSHISAYIEWNSYMSTSSIHVGVEVVNGGSEIAIISVI